jgi:UDP-galactopyranose mutase
MPTDRVASEHLTTDLVCFSHLRWDFVVQRPQHLMRRFARVRRVFFVEEPVLDDAAEPRLDVSEREPGVTVVVPVLPSLEHRPTTDRLLRRLIERMLVEHGITTPTFWYYTPMAMAFTPSLRAHRVIYDCMDELTAFRNAPPELLAYERELLARADHVFTGGPSLYESKAGRHPSVHAFPSSIDAAHFGQARGTIDEPADLRDLPHPRIGFYGVIDERCDLELLAAIAAARPEYSFIMVGPVVKIEESSLPRLPNLHYLGQKSYDELPAYLAHWAAAMMPFALNESTRFISPTKTPEFLAAGLPVVSTPIRDVVNPYGEQGLVEIAATAEEFVDRLDAVSPARDPEFLSAVDHALASTSWDTTWARMAELECRRTVRAAGATKALTP